MKYPKKTTALSIDVDKDAALYYDFVVPMLPARTIEETTVKVSLLDLQAIPWKEILPPNTYRSFDLISGFPAQMLMPYLAGTIGPFENVLQFIKLYELGNSDLVFHRKHTDEHESQPPTQDSVMITLSQLQLVDTSHATWEQIIEFRKDPASTSRLRRLRLFLTTSYEGKSPAFIEDDLISRLEDYDRAVRDWGFDTFTSCLSILVSSKHLLAAGTATAASILLGQPLVAAATAIAGASIEVSKISLELARRARQLKSLQQQHPLSYVLHARRQLSKEDITKREEDKTEPTR